MPSTRVKPRAKPQRRAPPPPGLLFLGGEPVVLPEGRVPQKAWPELAMATLIEPVPALYGDWLSRLERSLGVEDHHRALLETRAFSAAASTEASARARMEEAMRAAQLSAPLRDPVLVQKMAKTQAKLAAARAVLDDPPGKSDREKRKAVKQAKARIAEETEKLRDLSREEADQRQLYGDAGETILLAQARGEAVTAFSAQTAEFARDEFGARILERKRDKGRGGTYLEPVLVYGTGLRAKKLSGIDHAHDAGYLSRSWRESERLHKIGVDYRDAYEIVEGATGGEGEGGGSSGPKAPQPRLVEAGEKLSDFRRDLSQRQRDVLDMVCGEDLRLRDVAARMHAHFETSEKALREGLARAGESRAAAIARREGDDESTGARVARINGLLARVRG